MANRVFSCAVVTVVGGAFYLAHAVGPGADEPIAATSAAPATAIVHPTVPVHQTTPTARSSAMPRVIDVADEASRDPAESAARLDLALVRRFDDDRVDPAWAATTERAIADVFALPALAGSTISRIACRSAICRIEVDHADELAQRRFLVAAGPTPAFRGAGAARELVDPTHPAQRKTLVFLMREGEPLPAIN